MNFFRDLLDLVTAARTQRKAPPDSPTTGKPTGDKLADALSTLKQNVPKEQRPAPPPVTPMNTPRPPVPVPPAANVPQVTASHRKTPGEQPMEATDKATGLLEKFAGALAVAVDVLKDVGRDVGRKVGVYPQYTPELDAELLAKRQARQAAKEGRVKPPVPETPQPAPPVQFFPPEKRQAGPDGQAIGGKQYKPGQFLPKQNPAMPVPVPPPVPVPFIQKPQPQQTNQQPPQQRPGLGQRIYRGLQARGKRTHGGRQVQAHGRGFKAMGGGFAKFAKFAGPIGLAVAGTAAFAKSIIGAVKGIHDFAQNVNEGNRHLAQFSGQMSAAFAQLDIAEIRSQMKLAQATQGSASGLANEMKALKEDSQPLKETVGTLKNTVAKGGARLLRIGAKLGDFATEATGIKAVAEAIEGNTRQRTNRTPTEEWMRDLARGDWVPPRNPDDIAPLPPL